ncbi:MAG: hypothetical protein V1905_00110 [bacterium]
MIWLILTIVSYMLFGVTAVIDKFLLTKTVASPKKYAFIVGILGTLVFPLIILVDTSGLTIFQITTSLTAGILFIPTLVVFYEALKRYEASRVMPIYGGLTPIFILIIIFIIFGDKNILNLREVMALVLLIAGSIIVTYSKNKFTSSIFILPTLAALMMAIVSVITKVAYEGQSLISAIALMRAGSLTGSLFLIFDKEIRDFVIQFFRKPFGALRVENKINKGIMIFLINQGLVVVASLMQNIAVYFSEMKYVAIISAMAGVQYAFILIITIFLSRYFPQIMKEDINKKTLIVKIFSISLIIGGLALLAL